MLPRLIQKFKLTGQVVVALPVRQSYEYSYYSYTAPSFLSLVDIGPQYYIVYYITCV